MTAEPDLIDSLDPTGRSVASYVLDRHDAAIRILNPAYRRDGSPVSWREAGGSRFEPRSDLQWERFGVDRRGDALIEPKMGTVDYRVAEMLLSRLAGQGMPFRVAQWEGYADADIPDEHEHVTFPPHRQCASWATTADSLSRQERIPTRWWHPDMRWVVGNDLYARSVFLSADSATIAYILATPTIEAFPVAFTDPVTPEDR